MSCIPTQYISGEQIDNIEMRLECKSIGERKGVYRVLAET